MKTIGRTNGGGFLVEMTSGEHDEFILLSKVAEGGTTTFLSKRNDTIELISSHSDLQKTIGAIRTWMELKLNVNQIREIATYLDEAIGNKKL